MKFFQKVFFSFLLVMGSANLVYAEGINEIKSLENGVISAQEVDEIENSQESALEEERFIFPYLSKNDNAENIIRVYTNISNLEFKSLSFFLNETFIAGITNNYNIGSIEFREDGFNLPISDLDMDLNNISIVAKLYNGEELKEDLVIQPNYRKERIVNFILTGVVIGYRLYKIWQTIEKVICEATVDVWQSSKSAIYVMVDGTEYRRFPDCEDNNQIVEVKTTIYENIGGSSFIKKQIERDIAILAGYGKKKINGVGKKISKNLITWVSIHSDRENGGFNQSFRDQANMMLSKYGVSKDRFRLQSCGFMLDEFINCQYISY